VNGDMVWVPSMGILGMLMNSDGQTLTIQPFVNINTGVAGGETVDVAPGLVSLVWRPGQIIMGGPPQG
jgi:hypothetical protein